MGGKWDLNPRNVVPQTKTLPLSYNRQKYITSKSKN